MTLLLESLATDPFPPLKEPPPRMRASDADREAVVHTLLDALARGLLTLDEGDERVAAAYAARYLDELPRLTADLPPAPATAPAAPGWRSLASLIWLQVRTTVAALWRRTRRTVRARPRLVVGMLALLALLFLIAATAGGAGTGESGGHSSYGWDDDWDGDGHGWHGHDHDHHHHDYYDDDDDDDD
jgi:Domain of unknown function (DUF1707)